MKRKSYLVMVQGTELWIKILKCDLKELRENYRVTEEDCGDEVYVSIDHNEE